MTGLLLHWWNYCCEHVHYAEFTVCTVNRDYSQQREKLNQNCTTLVVAVALQGADCFLVADSCLINTIKENNRNCQWLDEPMTPKTEPQFTEEEREDEVNLGGGENRENKDWRESRVSDMKRGRQRDGEECKVGGEDEEVDEDEDEDRLKQWQEGIMTKGRTGRQEKRQCDESWWRQKWKMRNKGWTEGMTRGEERWRDTVRRRWQPASVCVESTLSIHTEMSVS